MNQYNSNSGSFPVFIDGTSSANSSGFEESTAPCDNLASIQRNWILVSPTKMQDRTDPSAESDEVRPVSREPA
jgi:hypothetical protein